MTSSLTLTALSGRISSLGAGTAKVRGKVEPTETVLEHRLNGSDNSDRSAKLPRQPAALCWAIPAAGVPALHQPLPGSSPRGSTWTGSSHQRPDRPETALHKGNSPGNIGLWVPELPKPAGTLRTESLQVISWTHERFHASGGALSRCPPAPLQTVPYSLRLTRNQTKTPALTAERFAACRASPRRFRTRSATLRV